MHTYHIWNHVWVPLQPAWHPTYNVQHTEASNHTQILSAYVSSYSDVICLEITTPHLGNWLWKLKFPHRKAQQNRAPPLKILMSSARPLVTCRSSWTNSWRSLFKSCWEGAELGNLRCSQLKSFLLWCVKRVWSREWVSGKNALIAMIQWYVIYIIQRIPMSIIIQEDIIQYQDLEMSPTRKTTTNPKGFTLDFGLFLVSWSGTAPDKGWFMMILLVSWCFSGLQQIEKTWMLNRLHKFLAVLFVFQGLGFQPGCFTPTFQEWFHFGFHWNWTKIICLDFVYFDFL